MDRTTGIWRKSLKMYRPCPTDEWADKASMQVSSGSQEICLSKDRQYVFNLSHISSPTPTGWNRLNRLSFSVAGSLVFNQGVMLLLAMLRLRLPNCKHVTIPLGVGACFGLVHLGRVYGHHCDSPHLIGTSGNSVSSTTTSLPNNGTSSTQLSSKSPSPKRSAAAANAM